MLSSFLLLVFCSCGWEKKDAAKTALPQVVPVKVMRTELKTVYESIEYSGNIRAQNEVLVYPRVSGKILKKIKEEGAAVAKDEVIAYIDRDEVGLTYEKAPVTSPIEGIIGRVYVDIGTNVNPGTAIALVLNMDKVKINLDVPEKYLPDVALESQAKIRVDAYPEKEFNGQVTKISPILDIDTRTAPVEILIDNPGHYLKSGMFTKVELMTREHKQILLILKEAVIGTGDNVYVYVIESNLAKRRKVTPGIRQGPYTQIIDGIKAGELVVIIGQQRLTDSAAVMVEE